MHHVGQWVNGLARPAQVRHAVGALMPCLVNGQDADSHRMPRI